MKHIVVPTDTAPQANVSIRNPAYLGWPKRALDLTLVLATVPISLPLIAGLAIATRIDGGPSFFGHTRIGQNGKAFTCWKLRTMVPNAKEKLAEHLRANPEAAAEWARDFKLENDPRVTKLGAFLRKTSLDELPQLWNILRGEMSLVGPRPVTRAEITRYGALRWAYFALRPGLTGIWQVSGRNDVTYDERVEMDVRYLSEASLTCDLDIIARTAGAVLNRTGR